jgi:hypothetical protein
MSRSMVVETESLRNLGLVLTNTRTYDLQAPHAHEGS